MNRRHFVNWMGVGAIAVSLPVAIAACTPKTDSADEPAESSEESAAKGSTADEFVLVGTTSELTQQGYVTNEEALSEPVIVIEDPTNPDSLIALSAKCTHTGCAVAWQEDLFACPCHGSKFNPDGSVVEGPASAPLARYATKLEGDSILVASI